MGKNMKVEKVTARRRSHFTITKPHLRSAANSGTAAAAAAANIKVVVRVRPPNQRETADNYKNIIQVVDEQLLIFDPNEQSQSFFYHGVQQKGRDLLRKPNKDLQFSFDRIFGYEATNIEMFESTTKNLIKALMDGFNCSVFAYGATGAGKTFTMLGQAENPGITYLTMTELFRLKQELSSERNFELGITYLEVYNETVQDLLNPGPALQVREDSRYGVTVSGIKVHKIEDPNELFKLLEKGNANRTQHPTDANAESSRSHAVFQVYIQMETKVTREVRAAKLSMIDLAGSERGSATGFNGARFTEGANINKSLLALGNCINSLADGQKHVPYRDSKLTRLLKDSLGGNCQTVMIANVSPSSLTYEDTYNTLKYATRAKKIKSCLKRNVVNIELHSGEYAKLVEDLRRELEETKKQLKNNVTLNVIDDTVMNEFKKIVDERKKLIERIYHVENAENMTVLRRQFKEDINSRLSDLCEDTPEKEDFHRRLGNMVDRFNRQEGTFKVELDELKDSLENLKIKMEEFVQKHGELAKIAEVETAKLAQIESQFEVELVKKKITFFEEELKHKNNLLETTWKTLQPCFLQLRGYGFTTPADIEQYQSLVRLLKGFKNITWVDPTDTCYNSNSSTTTSIMSSCNNTNKLLKRKLNDENSEPNYLNSTYVMEPSKPKIKASDELVVKAYKSPQQKKLASARKVQERRWIASTVTSKTYNAPAKRMMKHQTDGMGRPPFR